MSYYVEYNPEQSRRYPLKSKPNAAVMGRIIAGILILCTLLCCISIQGVRNFLIPGNPEITIQATTELLNDIQNGEDWMNAFSAFCETVVANAVE